MTIQECASQVLEEIRQRVEDLAHEIADRVAHGQHNTVKTWRLRSTLRQLVGEVARLESLAL